MFKCQNVLPRADMNGDYVYTISDLWLQIKTVYLLPANFLVDAALRDSDWWCITIKHDHFSSDDDELYRHREKLRREIHARSPEGQMERHRMINKLVKASADVAFQRLKRQLLAQARGAVHHG